MKFSYDLIKRLVPEAESKSKVAETLTMYAFDTEEGGGDVLEVDLSSNRYADASAHLGLAREYSAVSGKKVVEPGSKKVFEQKGSGEIKVKIEGDTNSPRYGAALFEVGKKGKTPAWMKKILEECGIRTIHPVVDILNYVMLEVGQPMHAFDADKLKGGIVVRRAKEGEGITTIDDQKFKLTKEDLVIADGSRAQAVAGIKGGKLSEIGQGTKRILIEAANFDQVRVYETSKRLSLVTDASARFARGMSPLSVEIGMNRATVLLEEIVGAKLIDSLDTYPKKQTKHVIGFNTDKFNSLTGLNFAPTAASKALAKLGFKKLALKSKSKSDSFVVEVPPLRVDVTVFEDLVEEVIRLQGINDLPPQAPHVSMKPARETDITLFKDQVRNVLTNLGFSEVYTYSYVKGGTNTAYEIENPIADDKTHLRQSLEYGLHRNIKENAKTHKRFRLFEVGNVFDQKLGERLSIGIAMRGEGEEAFLELRGAVEDLLGSMGLVDYEMRPDKKELTVKVNNKRVGRVWHLDKQSAMAELEGNQLMEIERGEREYEPISKFPAISRDLSLALRDEARVGDILQEVQAAGAKHVVDVDLIDYYDARHITFRVIFQSQERTLKDSEVSKEFNKIIAKLEKKFAFEVR